MYGQGNYATQFRQGPPAPSHPFPQAPQQAMPGLPPPPPVYQYNLPPPPAVHLPTPMSIGQSYMHPPPPIHTTTPMVPSYPQPGPFYPPVMPGQNAHHVLQSMPPPPPPLLQPWPAPPSQGQVRYMTPPPPPPGIQHVPTPPPPPPSSFVSITPASFSSFMPVADAQPPLPPSSPPPLPPSSPPSPPPPPPPSTLTDLPDIVLKEPSMAPMSNVDAPVAPAHSTDNVSGHSDTPRGEAIDPMSNVDAPVAPVHSTDNVSVYGDTPRGDVEEKASLVQGEEPGDLPSPPPKPVEEEVVQNIEVLCKFIADAGPHFENYARTKEAANPKFAFLFGGEPGSGAAIGHEYFLWMKRKYQFEIKSGKDLQQNVTSLRPSYVEGSSQSGNMEGEGAAVSPATSDVDMEDVSPVRAAPYSAECAFEDDVHGSGTPLGVGDSTLTKVSPSAAGAKIEEIPGIFVKDRSPFRLIQDYASDESEEDDRRENAEDINSERFSQIAVSDVRPENASLAEFVSERPTDSSQAVTSMMPKEAEFCAGSSPQEIRSSIVSHSSPVDLSDDKKMDDTMGTSELSQDKKIVEDDKKGFDQVENFNREEDLKRDTALQDVDEFGRLMRGGLSDSDSDGMHHNEKRGMRGRSWSRSRSPQETRLRRRRGKRSRSPRYSPRRRGKRSRSPSWSPERNRSKSPPTFRRTNVFARRDQDQEYPQDTGNYDAHDDIPVSDSYIAKNVTKVGVEECNKCPEIQDSKELLEACIETVRREVLDVKDAPGLVIEDAQPAIKKDASQIQVTGQVHQEVISQVQGPKQVGKMLEASKVSPMEEELRRSLQESSQPLRADNLPVQLLPAGKTQSLPNEPLMGQPPNSGENPSFQPSQSNYVSTTISEQPQNITQHAHVEGHMLLPLTVQAVQPIIFHNQTPEAQPFLARAPVTPVFPSQSPVTQPCTNYAPISQPSEQSLLPKEFPPPSLPIPGVNLQPSQLLPPAPHGHPPPLLPFDNTSLPFVSQRPNDNILPFMSHQPQRPPSHMFPSHGLPITSDNNPQRVPPNPTWSNFPPVHSHANALPSRPAFPPTDTPASQFQQNALPPRSDFNPAMKPISPGELPRSQVVDFRPPFHSVESSHQPSRHIDEFKQVPLLLGNQQVPPFPRDDRIPRPQMPGSHIILNIQRDYHLRQQPFLHEGGRTPLPGQGFNSSSQFGLGDIMHSQSLSFPREHLPNKLHFLPEDHLPPRFLPREQFPNVHDLLRQPPYGQQLPSSNNFPSNLSTPGMVDTSITRYSSSFPENNLPPCLSYAGVPKISTHYNPYASTFEQMPASLKFSPSVPGREYETNCSNRYDTSINSDPVPLDRTASRITASPPTSRVSSEQFLPRTGVYPLDTPAGLLPDVKQQSVMDSAIGDAYDPLFDSIEPSSNAFKKVDHVKENQVIHDVENTRQKGGVAAEPMSEADEFGEVATDAEAGVVENGSPLPVDVKDWSPGIPIDVGKTDAGEIDIDQVQSPGKNKNKKGKDSRSMKLFKLAIAEFVKEVLKPSWRQGNMSKEAFKTIVKKTVEKVARTMPSHQIPKTQVKINQYVESSQRKLTKLVMGYVDKYVKM